MLVNLYIFIFKISVQVFSPFFFHLMFHFFHIELSELIFGAPLMPQQVKNLPQQVKNLPARDTGDVGSIPTLRRSPGGGNGK